jgi:hypothetical protein
VYTLDDEPSHLSITIRSHVTSSLLVVRVAGIRIAEGVFFHLALFGDETVLAFELFQLDPRQVRLLKNISLLYGDSQLNVSLIKLMVRE